MLQSRSLREFLRRGATTRSVRPACRLHEFTFRCPSWGYEGSSVPDRNANGGSAEVQDALADILQIEVQRVKAKEELLNDLEARKEDLRKIGDELLEQLEQENKLDKMRMDLASNSSLADTMAQFSQVEEDVKKVRQQLQRDRDDLAAWEQQSAKDRSKGLFFKGLYQAPKLEGAGATKEDVERVAKDIQSPASAELQSPLRLYLFTYLTVILAIVVGADTMSASPDLATDCVLGILGVLLGYNACSERAAFQETSRALERKQDNL